MIGAEPNDKANRRRIVVWRHGRTAWNFEGRFQGQDDVALDPVGVQQARAAARLLAGLEPEAILSSDLSRAAATAAELAAVTGLQVGYDKGLRETNLGTWQGLTREEVNARFPGEAEAWLRGGTDRRGGGESMQEVAERCVAATEAALETLSPNATLVVVTHGGAGRVMIAQLIGLPPKYWRALGGQSNCCWSVIGAGRGGWALLEHNAGTLPEPELSDDR